jgi:hypothetical protein
MKNFLYGLTHNKEISMKLPKIAVCVFALLSSYTSYSDEIEFFAVGHADDWQLFMNPEAYKHTNGISNKSVFIHTTAGDAGLGAGSTGGKP